MTREEKSTIIEELKSKIKNMDYFYITDPQGMTVEKMDSFRKACFEANLEYKLYKNTLIKKSFDGIEGDFNELEQVLKGFSAILFSPESPNLPAKLLKKYYKDEKIDLPAFKGAYIDSSFFIGENQLDSLCKVKSKNELIGDLLGLLQSPTKNVISALQSGQNTITGVLTTLSERDK